jgi:hypothetical protein
MSEVQAFTPGTDCHKLQGTLFHDTYIDVCYGTEPVTVPWGVMDWFAFSFLFLMVLALVTSIVTSIVTGVKARARMRHLNGHLKEMMDSLAGEMAGELAGELVEKALPSKPKRARKAKPTPPEDNAS